MNILGLGYLSDAGACIVKDGRVLSTINEERLNRKKLFYGLPDLSVKWVLKDAKMKWSDIDVIVTQGFCKNEDGIEFIDNGLIGQVKEREIEVQRVFDSIENSNLDRRTKKIKIDEFRERINHENYVIEERNIQLIRKFKKYKKPIKVLGHHLSHAASAYYTSGWQNGYAITADGWGELESNILCKGSRGMIKKIGYSHSFHSLGYFYGSITNALGFIPHRHEGKVLGLAAMGNSKKFYPLFKDMIQASRKRPSFIGHYDEGLYHANFDNKLLNKALKGASREDVAAAAQKVLESEMVKYVKRWIPNNSNLAVAGGLFANVKLNQKILELPNIKNLYVFPQMGDGGLALGSALFYSAYAKKTKPYALEYPYTGPEYKDHQILKEIKKFKFKCIKSDEIEVWIAKLLAAGDVVMRFNGKMEFGPRALGNRSILFKTDDKNVNQWLNQALKRSEFMPFAPATLYEKAEDCYKNIKKHKAQALHMTMTFQCTTYMKKVSPAVVHVDGTARPQLVQKTYNPSFYKILKKFYQLTGVPNLVNTSFNMHEEPIVCSPNDALRAFQDSKLKYLAIGSYLVMNDEKA